ncbi:MAG TPA: cell envelope integrity protein TolA [Ideonella sp.]|nr:cell envelope integrity protein TolA [Ideonella sp.]
MTAQQTLPLPPASLRPPSADSHGTGALMSVLAHALLVAALALGVQWRTNEPDGVEAELWAATPEFAAPRAVEPEPEPPQPTPPPEPVRTAPPPPPPVVQPKAERDAEIAIERADKLRREKERQEAEDQRARERRQQAERDKKAEAEKDRQEQLKAEQKAEQDAKRKADQARAAAADKLTTAQQNAQREKMRQDQIRRMQAQLGGTGAPNSPGTAARTSGPSSSYAGRVRAYIKAQNKGLLTSDVPGNPTAEVEVTLAIDGTIKSTRLLQSSGSPAWDDLAVRAVERTGTLPLDVGGTTPTTMVISLRPNE